MLLKCVLAPCGYVGGSRALARLVPPRQRFGYDLVVHIGLARYLGGKQRDEIRTELREGHGIELSSGSVSALCDRFLLHLEALHLCRAPHLRAAMGGWYPLHIDATCDKGLGGLFICLDGRRNWVLAAERIPSERADRLRPVVEQTVALFGKPIATVRDLGEAGAKAVAPLRQDGVPDLVCHRHFLGAVGARLFDSAYSKLRRLLRPSGVRRDLRALLRELRRYGASDEPEGQLGKGGVRQELLALVHWVLDGPGKKDPAFPFALTHRGFVKRCREALGKADVWVPCPRSQPERRAVRRVKSIVARLDRDPRIGKAVEALDQRWGAFSELRGVLGLTNAELPGGTLRHSQLELPAVEKARLRRIEDQVRRYKSHLQDQLGSMMKSETKEAAQAVILKYLKDYDGHLFGHPALHGPDGDILAIVQRTNNPAEHLFGHSKQQLRRRVGRANLGRDMQQQPAQVALVHNLRDPAYVRVLCGSIDNLPAAFAELDQQAIQNGDLVRDHRDSQLLRCLRALLEAETAASAPRNDGASGAKHTAPPTVV